MSAARNALTQEAERLGEELQDRRRTRDQLQREVNKVRKTLEDTETGLRRHDEKSAVISADLQNVNQALAYIDKAERDRQQAQEHRDATLGAGI